ncbi:MAG: hypothetical protein EOO50_13815, partial [Flavobacterium sp.]|uniref:hypothetical protein n=1 Tax=Flavobacterium sp. TaxID=239 RepID=UPI001216310B
MNVHFQNREEDKKFIAFNETIFPERGELNRKLTDFRYFNPMNPKSDTSGNVVATDDDGKLIGQALYHKTDFFFDGNRASSEWGFDFFVVPERRNDLVGVHILQYVKANKPNVFAAGLGEKALKLQKMLGYNVIGYLKKYVKIIHPFFLPFGLLRATNLKSGSYPKIIGKGESLFERISLDELWNSESPYNENLIEFARDESFLKWRFYSKNFNYAVYRQVGSSGNPIYFALRTVKIKGITGLVLVDFRYDVKKPEQFSLIVSSAKKIATKMWLPILVTASSHKSS